MSRRDKLRNMKMMLRLWEEEILQHVLDVAKKTEPCDTFLQKRIKQQLLGRIRQDYKNFDQSETVNTGTTKLKSFWP